jgi:hypothetical protein
MEKLVRDRFGVGLYEFIRQKVEVEHLYDYEVATNLNVDGASIGKLRKTFGITRANAFTRRFERTYGNGAVDTFKTIIEDPDNSLTDLANHFGFTRQNARQVYQKVYRRPYTEAFRTKMLARKRKRLEARMKSTRGGALIKITEKIRCLGLMPRVTNKGPAFTILANGHKLALRCTSKPLFIGSKRYFRISHGVGSNGPYDFFICVCRNNGNSLHYVIPKGAMPKSGVHLLPEAGPDESKYAQFREAWHLLTHEDQRRRAS